MEASARLLAVREASERLAELGYEDQIVDARLRVAEVEAEELIKLVALDYEEELQVYTLRGLYAERRVYQTLSYSGLLRPIATRTLMQEIDDEIEEVTEGALEVEASRRGGRAWYKQAVRRLLAWMPEPAGENITEVEYSEVSARRLAAQRAWDRLERLKQLPNCDAATLDKAKETFAYWAQSATSVLSRLDTESDIDNVLLARRHAEALARIAAVEAVAHLVDAGLLSQRAADAAVQRIVEEVNRSHE